MSIGEIISIAGVAFLAVGLIATWVRNGRSQSKRDGIIQGAFEERINGIKKQLDDENTGLGAIKNTVSEQQLFCTKHVSSFDERMKSLEDSRNRRRKKVDST